MFNYYKINHLLGASVLYIINNNNIYKIKKKIKIKIKKIKIIIMYNKKRNILWLLKNYIWYLIVVIY